MRKSLARSAVQLLMLIVFSLALLQAGSVSSVSAQAQPSGESVGLKRLVTMQPTLQFMVERSDFEKYVSLNWEKFNDTLYSFTVQVEPLLLANVTSCLALPAGQRAGCFSGISNYTDDLGERVYDFDMSRFATRVIGGQLSSYPIKSLTGSLVADSASVNIAGGTARFNISFPEGLKPGQHFGVGFSSVNVSVTNSSELIIPLGPTVVTADFLPAVNRSSSILFITARVNDSQSRRGQASCILGNVSQATASQISCSVAATPNPGPVFIRWSILEFNQGVRVQHGTSNNSGAATVSKDEVISEVNVSNSFILHGGSSGTRSDWKQVWTSFEFHNSTVIRVNTAEKANNVSYQVVSVEGARVFTGNKTIVGVDNNILFNLSSPFQINRSFVLVANTHSGGNGVDIGSRNFMGSIINSTQVKLERGVTTSPDANVMNATWQLVELPAGNRVQNFSVNFAAGETIRNVSVVAVDLNRSVTFASSQSVQGPTMGITVHNASEKAGHMSATAFLTSTTNLQINRTANSMTNPQAIMSNQSNFTFFVIEFAQAGATGAVSDNNGTLNITLNNGLNFNVSQNGTFTVNATVSCQGGNCHQVNGTAYYNRNGGAISIRLNGTAKAIPLWNVSGFQNSSCKLFMSQNDVCSVNWTVNATGANSYHNLTINFTSNNTFVLQYGTTRFRLNISGAAIAPPASATESEGDTAISLGIDSSLSSATKYSEQQVYVRNLSNNQTLGMFDWVAAYGSQRWLINYITSGEGYVNAPNLTTAVYVLEIASKTSAQITDEVSLFINRTQ